MVTVDGRCFFIMDVPKASYEVNILELATLNLVMSNIRTVMVHSKTWGMDTPVIL